MRALILTDGKPGHENQSIALCRHLGLNYELAKVGYRSKSAKAISYLLDRTGIYTEILFQISEIRNQKSEVRKEPPRRPLSSDLRSLSCDLLISTGSTSFYPNKVIARKLGVPNVAILKPGGYRPDFSAILCPAYDHPPKRSNVTELPLNLCAADPSFFEEKAAEFEKIHKAALPAAAGFIIGGPNAVSEIDAAGLKDKLEQAFALTEGCERWVTTSRRTPPEIEQLVESLPFDYTLINSRDPYNPIPAFIRKCDRLFVTSDSASMVSECASFGTARVEILMNRQTRSPNKFEELFQGLEKLNAVHIFDGTLGAAGQKVDLKPLLKKALSGLV
jgi:mitochondrial fission protein ELM1